MNKILKEGGTVEGEAELSDIELVSMYKLMVKSRIFDERSVKLQRTGRMGTYAPFKGQEATQIGSAWALTKEDWLVPTFRDGAASFVHNFPMEKLIQYWQGDERGQYVPDVKIMPLAIPIATQMLHAVGIAWGLKLQNKKNIVLCFVGDGATSEGDFHEALNFAGLFKLPCVFIIQNNQYAISLPRARQTASKTLAEKASAYGFTGVQIDGNDVLAVYKYTKEVVEKCRKGEGPFLIECVTYRMGDHTTSDDSKRYRSEKEIEEWEKKDPILRLKKCLISKGAWDDKKEEEWKEQAEEEVKNAVKKAEKVEAPDVKDIFNYIFAEMPQNLKEQYEEIK